MKTLLRGEGSNYTKEYIIKDSALIEVYRNIY